MQSVPAFVLPMWGVTLVALVIALAILKSAPPTPEPRGLRAFLLPFAIPVAVTCLIVFVVTGIGTLLIVIRETVEQATGYVPSHEPGAAAFSPGAGAAIAVALVLALVILLGCAYLTSKPAHDHR